MYRPRALGVANRRPSNTRPSLILPDSVFIRSSLAPLLFLRELGGTARGAPSVDGGALEPARFTREQDRWRRDTALHKIGKLLLAIPAARFEREANTRLQNSKAVPRHSRTRLLLKVTSSIPDRERSTFGLLR